jgi:hypothetical protein
MAKKKTAKVTKKATKPDKKKVAKEKPAKKKLPTKAAVKKAVAKIEKKLGKPTKRDKAVEAAREKLYDGLYAVVMSAPSLVDARNIIEKELKAIHRTMLEEWYRDNPEDLIKDSEWEIDIKDKDDVANQAADFVGSMDDEEIDQCLMEYI